MCWALDRLGRSLPDLLSTLTELEGAGVNLFLHQQAIDTTTPAGRAFYQILGVYAEFERGKIIQRVRAGIERARSKGIRLGRPKVGGKIEEAIKAGLASGEGMMRLAKRLGVGTGTVQRVKAEMQVV